MKRTLLSLCICLLLAGCNWFVTPGELEDTDTPTPPDTTDTVTDTTDTMDNTDSGTPTFDGTLLSGKHTVTISTSLGDMEVELDADAAPRTVTNFVTLAKAGYYDGLIFHRVIPEFMIQGGDPEGLGTGGESIYGPDFEDEINAESYGLHTKALADLSANPLPDEMKDLTLQQYYELEGYVYDSSLTSLPMVKGALAMANRGPNTNGSQFFIIQADKTPWLEGKHTVFGNVTDGMDIVDAIVAVERGAQDKPVEDVVMNVEVK